MCNPFSIHGPQCWGQQTIITQPAILLHPRHRKEIFSHHMRRPVRQPLAISKETLCHAAMLYGGAARGGGSTAFSHKFGEAIAI